MNHDYNIALVGAGNIGFRHLEGILKITDLKIKIWIFEINTEVIEGLQNRIVDLSLGANTEIRINDNNIPKNIHLGIVATNSNTRGIAIKSLLDVTLPEVLILEKVLFQDPKEYTYFEDLFQKLAIKVYVNHPRRAQPTYQFLKSNFDFKENTQIIVEGNNWGMACNGLHFIDLVCFITNSQVTSIETNELDDEVFESKRKGFWEVSGELNVNFENNINLKLISNLSKDGFLPIEVKVKTSNSEINITESASTTITIKSEGELLSKTFPMHYQSSIATFLVRDILVDKKCSLPEYSFAAETHLIFINSLIEFFNNRLNKKESICLIT